MLGAAAGERRPKNEERPQRHGETATTLFLFPGTPSGYQVPVQYLVPGTEQEGGEVDNDQSSQHV